MRQLITLLLLFPLALCAQETHLFQGKNKDVVWTKRYNMSCPRDLFMQWLDATSAGGEIRALGENELEFYIPRFEILEDDRKLPYDIADKMFTGKGHVVFADNGYTVEISEIITIQKFDNMPYGRKGEKIPLKKYFSFKKNEFRGNYKTAPYILSDKLEEMYEVRD